MGSMVYISQINSRNGMRMEEVIPQSEPNPEGSSCSSVSTPEPDGEILLQGAVKRQKRKGGRKPIYATSEERKQRNRQAQAAFRERRTEYMKQLETTIKHNEETLQSLQQSHRNASDECLMLRYKNSLLERILLEKGIDVQAELRLKSGSPNMLSAKHAGQTISQNSTLSRAASNRQSVNRHKVGETPKLDHSNISQAHREDAHTMSSPQLHPTPTSHVSSPSTAKSPGFNLQGGISIPGAEIQPQQQKDTSQLHQLLPPSILPASSHYSSNGNGSNGHHCISATSPDPATPMTAALQNVSSDSGVNMDRTGSGYYLSPFQKHYDQLEQEYETQIDMLDEDEHDLDDSTEDTLSTPAYHEPSTPPSGIARSQPQPGPEAQAQVQQNEHDIATSLAETTTSATTLNEDIDIFVQDESLFNVFDPMLDPDPFGLTASMHFQTPFSYVESHVGP
ncbi:MeaB protein [Histoplasma ohiense]|nr:MeaB protein [Histoplasma ohiense (nom. inval.)]